MKRKLLLCLLLAGSFYLTTNAQIQKGKWIGELTLSGENKRSTGYDNNVYNSNYLENSIGTSIVFNKILNKNLMLGVGLNFNTFMKSYYSTQIPSNSTRFLEESYGPIAQIGYYKEVAKNLFLFSVFQMRYNYLGRKYRGEYNYPTEKRNNENGRQVAFTATPLQLNYLFKKRYLIGLNLATINYYNNKITDKNFSYTIENYTYSLNPFRNGITFSYIFK